MSPALTISHIATTTTSGTFLKPCYWPVPVQHVHLVIGSPSVQTPGSGDILEILLPPPLTLMSSTRDRHILQGKFTSVATVEYAADVVDLVDHRSSIMTTSFSRVCTRNRSSCHYAIMQSCSCWNPRTGRAYIAGSAALRGQLHCSVLCSTAPLANDPDRDFEPGDADR